MSKNESGSVLLQIFVGAFFVILFIGVRVFFSEVEKDKREIEHLKKSFGLTHAQAHRMMYCQQGIRNDDAQKIRDYCDVQYR